MGEKKNQAHKALYRKYRSKSLDEIVGQEHITKTLNNAIKSGKVSHAYLFTGPKGVGKTSIARILAHEINGIPYNDDSTHLDIIEIDAASNRRIDDIRDLREKVNLAPVSSKYKVYIIDEVHMLTAESFNALLKTLEEPPEHVVFILATTEFHKLPATIVSRTQRHTFRAVPKKQVVNHLADIAKNEDINISNEALELLAEHGEGSFRDSISLLDQLSQLSGSITRDEVESLIGLAPTEQIHKLLGLASSGDTKQVVENCRELSERGVSASATAKQLIAEIQNLEIERDRLALMQELISVPASSQPDLSLEIALLNFALKKTFSPSPTKSVEASVAQKQITEAKPPKTEPEKKQETPKPVAPKPKAAKNVDSSEENLQEYWQDIIKEIKERNSSLYTAMRLAKPALEGETLKLVFEFPFHKKRVDEAKNLSLISEIVSNHINLQPSVETTVIAPDKKPQVEEIVSRDQITGESSPDPAHASLIASVQDIMGGGEIVDARNT